MISHFTMEEFLHSDTANSIGASNYPTWEVAKNLERLGEVMERIRNGLGGHSVTINSGYRSPPVNDAVGGADNSAHLYGLACDFVIPDFGTPLEVCKAIEPHLKMLGVDQLIHEMDSWIHIGIAAEGCEPNCECLTIDQHGTRYGIY